MEPRPLPAHAVRTVPTRSFILSLTLAGLMHAAILGAAITKSVPTAGGAGTDLEAIGIDVVSSEALESRRPSVDGAGGQRDQIDVTEGAAPIETAAMTQPPPSSMPPPPAPIWSVPPDLTPPPPHAIVLPAQPPKIEPVDAAKIQTERRPDAPPAKSAENPQPPAVDAPPPVPQGGVLAQAMTVDPGATGQMAVRAAPGVVQAYGRAVGEALKATRPRASSALAQKGRVWVEFTIGGDGALERLVVTTSSGHQNLDQVALNAVRLARLPRPDPRLTATQRTFSLPYTFR